MSVLFFAACKRYFRLLGAATILMSIGAAAGAQTPTQDPLNALKSLTPDQQQSLLQSVLGNGDDTTKKTDSKLKNPETVEQRNDRLGGLEKESDKGKTFDGHTLRKSDEDPEIRAGDSILIDLTPVELAEPEPNPNGTTPSVRPPPSAASAAGAAGAGALSGAAANQGGDKGNRTPPSDFGRRQLDSKPKTNTEISRSFKVRERILGGNPYQLNQFGVLEIPGLPSIPLAGLTAEEASRRLSADPDMRDYVVKVTLLRLVPLNDAAVKPFGYDLFRGVPSTFAPVKDIQVPIDYVVGPGDTFNIQLYGNESSSYTLTVSRDGLINFPRLGPILVSGMGFDAARAALEHRVAQQLVGTHVSVTMGDLRSIRVFVLGEAEKPGSYTVSGLSTMTNALFVTRRGETRRLPSQHRIETKRQIGFSPRSLRSTVAWRYKRRSSVDAR